MKYLLLLLLMAGCGPSAIEQINGVKKPATVFSKHECKNVWTDPAWQLTVRDADGKLIPITGEIAQFCEKYQIGDTLK